MRDTRPVSVPIPSIKTDLKKSPIKTALKHFADRKEAKTVVDCKGVETITDRREIEPDPETEPIPSPIKTEPKPSPIETNPKPIADRNETKTAATLKTELKSSQFSKRNRNSQRYHTPNVTARGFSAMATFSILLFSSASKSSSKRNQR